MIETGRAVAVIARELEINEGTLGSWVNEWKKNNPEPEKALTPVERARVAEMEAADAQTADGERVSKKSSGICG
ncbi:MAG: transposase [Chloroflexi bacterium]|nr:transposase [Chloroflexota bacterium]